jgi:hypothetical protein
MKEYKCSCGYGNGKNHTLSEGNCARQLATGSLIPTNFRKERLIPNIHKKPIEVCDVNGYTISVWTLKNQRMYAQKPDGAWTLPKNKKSTHSLSGF